MMATTATLSLELEGPALDTKDTGDTGSLMNSLLPDIIKRRAGRLPFLRNTLTASSSAVERHPPPPSSPPPPYVSPATATTTSLPTNTENAPRDSHPLFEAPRPAVPHLSTSGIRWKHVQEGCRLLEHARREAAARDEDPELARKMYVDGIGYLLQGMPVALDAAETARLESHLPESLRTRGDGARVVRHDGVAADEEGDKATPNHLAPLIANLTTHTILLLALLLPLLERLVAAAYRYDQRYRISGRMAQTTSQVVSAVGKRVLVALHEGKAGQVALGATVYAVEGASRGFVEGCGRAARRQREIEARMAGEGIVDR